MLYFNTKFNGEKINILLCNNIYLFEGEYSGYLAIATRNCLLEETFDIKVTICPNITMQRKLENLIAKQITKIENSLKSKEYEYTYLYTTENLKTYDINLKITPF